MKEIKYSKNGELLFKQGRSPTEEKVSVVSELWLTYSLMILLQISGLARSVYYYTLSKIDKYK